MREHYHAGRAVVLVRYVLEDHVERTGVLLGLEGLRNKYGLPGGTVEPGEQPLDATLRELYEEFGLQADAAEHLYDFQGQVCHHHVFAVRARGMLVLDPEELLGIGFLGNEMIPCELLERHVQALDDHLHKITAVSYVEIPAVYLYGSTDPSIKDWAMQKREFCR